MCVTIKLPDLEQPNIATAAASSSGPEFYLTPLPVAPSDSTWLEQIHVEVHMLRF